MTSTPQPLTVNDDSAKSPKPAKESATASRNQSLKSPATQAKNSSWRPDSATSSTHTPTPYASTHSTAEHSAMQDTSAPALPRHTTDQSSSSPSRREPRRAIPDLPAPRNPKREQTRLDIPKPCPAC